MDVLGCTKCDIVFVCLSLACFFALLGSFALCLRCLRLLYNLFCVVVDSVVVVSGCQLGLHCHSLQWIDVGGCRL